MKKFENIAAGSLLALVVAFIIVGTPISINANYSVSTSSAHADILSGLGIPGFCGLHRCTLDDLSAACKTDSTVAGNCNGQDQEILAMVKGCSSNASFWSWDGATYGCSDTQTQQAPQASQILASVPINCDGLTDFWNQPTTCIGQTISSVMSGALVYVASWTLTLSGYLFDWVFTRTILQFGGFVNQNVIQGINAAWTIGRDLSNIIIIAMFTFIAIATILGNAQYGVRRLLSKVLVVAVLINFSLLFSKIIVDFSNFTAVQLYTASSKVIPASSNTAASANIASVGGSASQSGISGAFMQYAGVSSFGDTYKAVGALAKQQNSWIALLFGIFVALLFLAAAAVLLYGTFLLVTRALVLIFLMVTASLAFATYLWPKFSESEYGWNAWWNALFKNAVFAPLLMFFLWVTLTLGAAFSASSGSLGQLLIEPKSSINVDALLGYILVIGLLFASFKLSSSFSSSVSGLNLGQYAFDLGRSRVGGLLWQQTAGRFAYGRERAASTNARIAGSEAEKIRRNAARMGSLTNVDEKELRKLDTRAAKNTRRANTFGAVANKGFGGVQSYAGGIGKPGSTARDIRHDQLRSGGGAKNEGSQAGTQNPQMDDFVRQQRELTAAIAAGEKESAATKQQMAEQLKQLASSNKEFAEAQKTIASDAADRKQIEDKHSEEMIKKQIESANSSMDADKRAQQEYDLRRGSEDQRASELRHQNEKIEQATQQIKQITENDPQALALQKHLKEVDEKLGMQRSQAQSIDQKIQALQNNAPTAGTPPTLHEPVTVSIATNNNEDVFAASRGRTLRAEVFRPNATDVAMHTNAIVQDRPLPGQQNAA